MLKILTKTEEMRLRREGFSALRPGTLFNLGQERFFVAARPIGELEWEVVELDDENRRAILEGHACTRSRLHWAEMSCLNLEKRASSSASSEANRGEP